MNGRRGIAILGSTGSIGRSTLAVIALHPERYRVSMLGAHTACSRERRRSRMPSPAMRRTW
jgi:1-deoxy-D-xylulose-5-phosphate reductoisomerase